MQKLRLIQCGAGGMGKTWWNGPVSASPDFELAALVDVAEKPLHEAADAISMPRDRCFRSLEQALSAVDADALLTVTPPAVHVEHAKLAFARGLHLLTEKPIAHDLDAAKLMVKLAHDAGRQLMVAQNYRYSPAMLRLASLLREQPLGAFGHGHIDFYIPADFTGSFRETMEYPLLVDMAIHHLDLIRAVTGLTIRRVTAHTFRPAWSWYQHHPGLKMHLELATTPDDSSSGEPLELLPFSYSGDWSAFGKATTWNGNWRLQCERGSIHCEQDKITLARCGMWGKDPTIEEVAIPTPELVAQRALLARFAESIRRKTPAETSGADNLWSFGAVMAGVKSARESRTIDVAELLT